ncbi:hypothetical protein COO60DRAFT_1125842 [Scenedesmus sp. NREL 46B-D3]|nr:hypothetical protein COO60DRAFT_1125842 [Scenedesmus sp. NREL 46B-D3]
MYHHPPLHQQLWLLPLLVILLPVLLVAVLPPQSPCVQVPVAAPRAPSTSQLKMPLAAAAATPAPAAPSAAVQGSPQAAARQTAAVLTVGQVSALDLDTTGLAGTLLHPCWLCHRLFPSAAATAAACAS